MIREGLKLTCRLCSVVVTCPKPSPGEPAEITVPHEDDCQFFGALEGGEAAVAAFVEQHRDPIAVEEVALS